MVLNIHSKVGNSIKIRSCRYSVHCLINVMQSNIHCSLFFQRIQHFTIKHFCYFKWKAERFLFLIFKLCMHSTYLPCLVRIKNSTTVFSCSKLFSRSQKYSLMHGHSLVTVCVLLTEIPHSREIFFFFINIYFCFASDYVASFWFWSSVLWAWRLWGF